MTTQVDHMFTHSSDFYMVGIGVTFLGCVVIGLGALTLMEPLCLTGAAIALCGVCLVVVGFAKKVHEMPDRPVVYVVHPPPPYYQYPPQYYPPPNDPYGRPPQYPPY